MLQQEGKLIYFYPLGKHGVFHERGNVPLGQRYCQEAFRLNERQIYEAHTPTMSR